MSLKVGIITLGCKVNQYESEAFTEELKRRGYFVSDGTEVCDAYIVNTCTVTAEADRKSKQMIRRAARTSNGAPIVVTGCTAEYSAEELSSIEGVIAVCGNAEKMKCVDILDEYFKGEQNEYPLIHIPSIWEAGFEKMSLSAFPRTRVYIKIEDGCENKCAYCAIPKARGNVRSKLPEDILREVKGFIDEGCPEIVLTGIETASYGKDLAGIKLGNLLRLVDAIAGKCRIRLGSLDPSLFKEDFVNEIKSLESLSPHFHISLQSGSSGVLALMRRKYNANMAREAIQRIRQAIPNVMLTTDVIVGFPGETDDDFIATAEFLRDARFLSAHIFPYSEREGTPAATMPNSIPVHVRKERAAALSELQKFITSELLSEEIEREPERVVLFETYSDGKAYGHTDSFIEVCVESPCDLRGEKLSVRLNGHNGVLCFGEITDTKKLKTLIPGDEYIPKRKSGVIKGFIKADNEYLDKIALDLKLEKVEYLKLIQDAFKDAGKDPTVAEVYFYYELYKDLLKQILLNKRISFVQTADEDVHQLLSGISKRYSRISDDKCDNPIATSLAEFAASSISGIINSGMHICKNNSREYAPPYSGDSESVEIGEYVFTLSSPNPLGSKDAGEICVVVAPPRGMDINRFITATNEICKRFSEIDSNAAYVPASSGGFLKDLQDRVGGALIDTTLLPKPSAYAEAALLPINPALMIFTRKRHIADLWKISNQYSIEPCAPAIIRPTGFTVKAPEGTVTANVRCKYLDLELSASEYGFDPAEPLTTGAIKEKSFEYDFSIAPVSLSATELEGIDLYKELEGIMSDKEAVYAVCGTVSSMSNATVPMILTLDAFVRNNEPQVLYSRFFEGDCTSLCVIKLTQNK